VRSPSLFHFFVCFFFHLLLNPLAACFLRFFGATPSPFTSSRCSAPAAARAAPPSPSVATPVCPVSDCACAAAAAVAVCPVCSSSSRCRFFAAGVDAAPAVSLLAAAPVLLLLAPSRRCAVAVGAEMKIRKSYK
jgi:hypothetical protein